MSHLVPLIVLALLAFGFQKIKSLFSGASTGSDDRSSEWSEVAARISEELARAAEARTEGREPRAPGAIDAEALARAVSSALLGPRAEAVEPHGGVVV